MISILRLKSKLLGLILSGQNETTGKQCDSMKKFKLLTNDLKYLGNMLATHERIMINIQNDRQKTKKTFLINLELSRKMSGKFIIIHLSLYIKIIKLMISKEQNNPYDSNAQQRSQQDTLKIEQKETSTKGTTKQQTEDQDERKLIKFKYPPKVQRTQTQQEQQQASNFDDQNNQAQSPKKRRISNEQLYKVQKNLEDKFQNLLKDKFEELKETKIQDSLNAMAKIQEALLISFSQALQVQRNIFCDEPLNLENEQKEKDQIQIPGSIQNPFDQFEQLNGVEKSNFYYLKFEDTCLKVYVDVSDYGRWLRLWYKEVNSVQGMLEKQYVSKAFGRKILEKLKNLGISADKQTINTKQNWIVREIQLSCDPTSALKEIDMIFNLLNGKTLKGKEYSLKQSSGQQLLHMSGKFDSFTYEKIPH
ncbi:hypothetical protein pb186bvf_020625, partial [Paramecium bursaria]